MNVMKNLCIILTDKGREKIKLERERKFGSQMTASQDIGIPQVNISRWERGAGDPRFYLFTSYLRKLGLYKGFLKNREYVTGTKYRGFKIKKIKSTKLTKEKAYILGVVGPGDGYISGDYSIGLDAIDKDFVDYFQYCLEKVFGLKCKRYLKNENSKYKRQYVVRLCSKSAVESFKKYQVSFKECKWRVPKEIRNGPNKYKAMYLKGIFDSQACVVTVGKFIKTRIKNKKGVKEIQILLNDLGIDSQIFNSGIDFQISGKKNLNAYYSKVGFIIKRKIESLKNILDGYRQEQPTRKEVIKAIPKMIKLRKKNLSYRKIASIIGIGRGSVGRNLQKLGY